MARTPVRLARPIAIVMAAAIVGGLAYTYLAKRLAPPPDRPLRIGFEPNPPFQARGETGFTGLAVDITNQAARRAGIRLQWVETGFSSEESFRKGLVDLWPLMADIPERRSLVHFTEPWIIAGHVVLLHEGTPVPDQSYSGRVAHFKLPLHSRLVAAEFPRAALVPLPDPRDVLREVCRGSAIGFLEKRVAMIAIKEAPPPCALKLHSLLHLSYKIGIASTFESSRLADSLRREIGVLFREGALAQTIALYSFYGLDDAWSTYDLFQEAERGRWWAWFTGGVVVLLTLTIAQIVYVRQRRRNESVLRESEERFRAIFQQAGVGVAQIGLDGKIQIANDRYCEVVGYPSQDLVGMGTIEITHRDDLKEEAALRPRLLSGEIPFLSTEKRYTRRDGSTIWATMCRTVVRDQQGRPQSFIAVVEDITQRKQAEAALRESEERFRNLADSAPVLIWMCGPDRQPTFYNRGWLRFSGRSLDEALAAGWTSDIHPDDAERCFQAYTAAFETGRDYEFECRLRRADGEYRWFLNRGVARTLPDGSFSGFIGCSIDTTELKRGYERHLAMQKLESVGILAAGVAHDFNNLLGAIAALAESAGSELAPLSPASVELHEIHQRALDGAHIASQLMTFTRPDNAPAATVDLSALIAEMLELLRVSISKSVILETSLSPALPPIHANPSEIRQLVMNLVINGSEALEGKPGSVTVTTSPAVHNGAPAVRLEIADTGSGIAPDAKPKIFDPFFTTRSIGRGLGLSAVQGIVRRLGGSIDVETAPGAGARFAVVLPRQEHAEDPLTRRVAAAREARPVTVLFVDDEEMLRSSVAKLLRKRDFHVIEAGDGPSAVQCLKDANPSTVEVILLDVTLPGMPGVQVFDALRHVAPEVKVIVCTAYSQETAMAEFGDRKIDGFIRKPYRAEELANLLRQCSESVSRDVPA